jgi:SpoVK/Ycf46/Vps4 family AAA+-type ATPase
MHNTIASRKMRTLPTGKGVVDSRFLPDSEFDQFWNAIIVEEEIKSRLECQALLNFSLRPHVPTADLPLHGIILLVGPPGTGKTSLARGLASRIASFAQDGAPFVFIEVDPHTLTGTGYGQSQRSVQDFLGSTVAEASTSGPVIVLLDEVETLAADRSQMNLDSNPIDALRATDAVLAQLDHIGRHHHNVLFIATSNFPDTIDAAFLSRADAVISIGMPNREACKQILENTLLAVGKKYPAVAKLVNDKGFLEVAESCHGLDARRIRKLVVTACTFDKKTAVAPSNLKLSDLKRAIEAAKVELRPQTRK